MRSLSGSVSKTWNSINPATLSGAIDVIVVELEDGKSCLQECFRGFQAYSFPRDLGMFAVSRSVWQILFAETF